MYEVLKTGPYQAIQGRSVRSTGTRCVRNGRRAGNRYSNECERNRELVCYYLSYFCAYSLH